MNYEKSYKKILKNCLKNGILRNDRTGIGSRSVFSQNLSFDISKRFPMLTGKKMFLKTFQTEFDWFINGETNIKRFKENNVKIWDSWADSKGDLGPVYGYQMLNYNGFKVNQLEDVIKSLKSNPDSRRHIISLWNPLQLKDMALPPCYLYFQFFVDNGKLNLHVVQRSGDLFLGIPYDVAVFSLLLLYVSEKTNLKTNIISLNIVDAHLYLNQIDAAKKYLEQDTFDLPKYIFKNQKLELINYNHSDYIKVDVSI